MKKIFKCIALLCAVVCCILACAFSGCGEGQQVPQEHTIQYSVGSDVRKITVKDGETYVLSVPSERFGYEFKGYFDSASGGIQFTDSDGASLSAFNEGKNIVLFPQYEPKEYKLILEADDRAEGEFTRSFKIKYDEPLPELPLNLQVANKNFAGWYTRENGKGDQIADRRGIIPGKEIFNKENFDISDSTKQITLYSYFEWQKYNITFKFDGYADETTSVEYGTDISKVIAKTRNAEGEGVLSWSKTSGGDLFDGKVTEDITLYAVEWAPVIELNLNGGEGVEAVVARENADISLPTPVRENYKFVKWVYENGDAASISKMPAGGAKLKAVWQAMIVFDENGGSDVSDISKPAGESITLPVSSREGYTFAGWYTSEEELYTQTKMPSEGITLKAGWYKEIAEDLVIIDSNKSSSAGVNEPDMSRLCYVFDHSKYFKNGESGYIRLKIHISLRVEATNYSERTVYLDIYNKKSVSSQNLVKTYKFENVTEDSYKEFTIEFECYISNDLYFCWYCPGINVFYDDIYLSDFYRTLYYPDTSTLYL